MTGRELLVKLGFKIDNKKLDQFTNNVAVIQARITELQAKVNEQMMPKMDASELTAYKKELSELTIAERKEVEALNKAEDHETRASIKRNQAKIRELRQVKSKIDDNARAFRRMAREARIANDRLSRFFTRFTLGVGGGLLLNLRGTLKSAEEEKSGRRRTSSGGFSDKDLQSVNTFNRSLTQTKRIATGLRNNFIAGLLPSLGEFLDKMNYWLVTNRELIKSKLDKFVGALSGAISNVASAVSKVGKFLAPIVDKVGGLETVFTVLIGGGIISWLARLGAGFVSTIRPIGTLISAFYAWAKASKAVKFVLTAISRNPMVLVITGLVAALGLLIDELYVTAKGGDSLINRFKATNKVVGALAIVVEGFTEGLKDAWSWAKKLLDVMLKLAGKAADEFSNLPAVNLFGDGKAPEWSKGFKKVDIDDTDLNVYSADASQITPKFAENARLSKAVSAKNNVTNNQTVNLSLNLPEGTSDFQAQKVIKIVNDQVGKLNRMADIEMLNATGVTN